MTKKQTGPYDPTKGLKRANALLTDARCRLASMNATDAAHGVMAPHEAPVVSHFQTALAAIASGLEHRDFEAVADGLALLVEVGRRMEAGEAGKPGDR